MLELLSAGGPLALAILVVHILVRQLKEDAPLPIDLPARYRPLAVIVLSVGSAGLDKVVQGTSWKAAGVFTAYTVAGAVLLHVFGVNVINDGKEIAPAFKMPRVPPAAGGLLFCVVMWGCNIKPSQVDSGADVAQGVCSVLTATTQDGTVKTICATVDEVATVIQHVLATEGDANRPAAIRCSVISANGTSVCASDAALAKEIDGLVAKRMAAQKR